MKEFRFWAAVTVALYVLQTSLLSLLAYHGVSANLLLLWIVSFALLKGYRIGVFMGFCGGLLQDLSTGTFFGCNTFSYMVLAFLCGKLTDRVFREDNFPPVFFSTVASIGHYCLMAMIMYLLGYRFQLSASIRYTLIPTVLYQLILAWPVYRFAYSMDEYFQKNK